MTHSHLVMKNSFLSFFHFHGSCLPYPYLCEIGSFIKKIQGWPPASKKAIFKPCPQSHYQSSSSKKVTSSCVLSKRHSSNFYYMKNGCSKPLVTERCWVRTPFFVSGKFECKNRDFLTHFETLCKQRKTALYFLMTIMGGIPKNDPDDPEQPIQPRTTHYSKGRAELIFMTKNPPSGSFSIH